MNSRTTPIVRLEGPLALGHGLYSLPNPAIKFAFTRTRSPLSSASHCVTSADPMDSVAAVSPRPGDCSRVLTSVLLVKPASPRPCSVTIVTPVKSPAPHPKCAQDWSCQQCCATVGDRAQSLLASAGAVFRSNRPQPNITRMPNRQARSRSTPTVWIIQPNRHVSPARCEVRATVCTQLGITLWTVLSSS